MLQQHNFIRDINILISYFFCNLLQIKKTKILSTDNKMKKTIVIYYSNNGSNRYLANKIATSLSCEIEEIKPRMNAFLFQLTLSGFKKSMGIKKIQHNLDDYENIILCGPIWMGTFISPLRTFVKKYKNNIKKLHFITCCGSTYAKKDEKFGHGLVFKTVEAELGEKCGSCHALPIELVIPEDKQDDSDAQMKTRLNDTNFTGEIQERFDDFILKMSLN